jgi:hypothetical protein
MDRVDQYAVPFMGVDVGDLGSVTPAWLGQLYTHSNFSVLGIYLSHGAPRPSTNASAVPQYNGTSWTMNWQKLRALGWGYTIFYVGYQTGDSNTQTWAGNNPSAATLASARSAGIWHAKHIKVGVSQFLKNSGDDHAGCVVYVDNEYHALSVAFRAYYNSMFEEMRKPGPGDCQAVRPGLYARDQNGMPNASEMLDSNPDLFVWLLDHHLEASRGRRISRKKMGPIPDETNGRIRLDPALFDIRGRRRNDISSGHTVTNIPVGIQGFLNYGLDQFKDQKLAENPCANLDNYPPMPTRVLANVLTPQTPWDFDMSFVQDPRYPVASPRVQCVASTLAKGFYVKAEKRMQISVSNAQGTTSMAGALVEPDAPILFPDESCIISLDTSGNIVVSNLTVNPPAWTPFARAASTDAVPPLRRSRALTVTKFADNSIHIFYIARDLSLQTLMRQDASSQWVGPTAVLALSTPVIHGFTNIASLLDVSNPRIFNIFTISETEHLQWTTYKLPPGPNAAPSVFDISIESERNPPSLLQGTQILAVAPYPYAQIVFAVSRSLRLTMFSNVLGQSWTDPVPLGDETSDRVFAHTRLAANIINPTLIQVAAVSYEGDPMVFTLAFDSKAKTWALFTRPAANPRQPNPQYFPRRRTKPPALGPALPLLQGEADARQWSINPFGDINFGIDPSGTRQTVLMITGSGPDTAVDLMYRRIAISDQDWYLRS